MFETLKLKDLPVAERPRERFELKGASAVSLKELLAIAISSGNKQQSALEIAEGILSDFGTLEAIENATISKLSSCSGIGYARALRIKAALELGKRFYLESPISRSCILDSFQAFKIASYYLKGKMQEILLLFSLNARGMSVSDPDIITIGTLDASCVHPREIFKKAIDKSASRVLMAHNHPSGNAEPSDEDLHTTSVIYKSGSILGMELVDHIIVAGDSFCSIRELHPELFST